MLSPDAASVVLSSPSSSRPATLPPSCAIAVLGGHHGLLEISQHQSELLCVAFRDPFWNPLSRWLSQKLGGVLHCGLRRLHPKHATSLRIGVRCTEHFITDLPACTSACPNSARLTACASSLPACLPAGLLRVRSRGVQGHSGTIRWQQGGGAHYVQAAGEAMVSRCSAVQLLV